MMQTYDVEIMGQKFSIKSNDSPAYVDRIIHYVSEKMKKIAKSQKAMSLHHISILTLLNITDELFKHQAHMGEYKERVAQKAKNILRALDA